MAVTSEIRSPADLRTDRPLPREIAHKSAPEQVFVTDWMLGPGDDWCTIAGRLPLAHARFSDSAAGYHDLLLIAEAVRQAGLVVASEIIQVEDDRQFILRELMVKLDPIEHARKSRDACDLLISQDSGSKVKMRPGRSTAGAMMRARVSIGGRPAGVCEVMGAWVPDEFYTSLRKGMKEVSTGTDLPAPTRHRDLETRTGKLNPANSAIAPIQPAGERSYRASLAIETDDPTFFDHPLDHVPGLYLLEGIQQAVVAATCAEMGVDHSSVLVSGFHMKFSRIAEFQPDVICAAVLNEDCRGAQVSCEQDGSVCCEGTVSIAHL